MCDRFPCDDTSHCVPTSVGDAVFSAPGEPQREGGGTAGHCQTAAGAYLTSGRLPEQGTDYPIIDFFFIIYP